MIQPEPPGDLDVMPKKTVSHTDARLGGTVGKRDTHTSAWQARRSYEMMGQTIPSVPYFCRIYECTECTHQCVCEMA